jgi:hypothetical protein
MIYSKLMNRTFSLANIIKMSVINCRFFMYFNGSSTHTYRVLTWNANCMAILDQNISVVGHVCLRCDNPAVRYVWCFRNLRLCLCDLLSFLLTPTHIPCIFAVGNFITMHILISLCSYWSNDPNLTWEFKRFLKPR